MKISFFCSGYLEYITNCYVSKDTEKQPNRKMNKNMSRWFAEVNGYLVSLVIKENEI